MLNRPNLAYLFSISGETDSTEAWSKEGDSVFLNAEVVRFFGGLGVPGCLINSHGTYHDLQR